jgi:hypothetical protein
MKLINQIGRSACNSTGKSVYLQYHTGTQSSMVDKRFLLFLFLLVSVCVHTHECFTIGRELFGIEKEAPSGKNDNDKNKTTLTMEKTIINYKNAALQAQHRQKDKNPLIGLLQTI